VPLQLIIIIIIIPSSHSINATPAQCDVLQKPLPAAARKTSSSV
jgi:hypothetical protein